MFTGDYFPFKPFVGIVRETEANRVRVRIFGVHPFDEDGQSTGPAQEAVSDGDLPWATIIYPVDSSGADHTIETEDWVIGYFADGESSQMPVVTGIIENGDGSTGSGFFSSGPSSGSSSGGSGGSFGGSAGAGNLTGSNGAPVKANAKKYYNDIPGDSNTQKAFNLFTTWLSEEKGMPLGTAQEVAAGIVGSLAGESGSSLNPGAYNPNDRGKPSEGIAQWRAGRQRALHQMCGRGTGNLDCQLNFAISELEKRGMGHRTEGTERGAANALLRAKSRGQATDIWTRRFERPQHASAEANKRKRIYSNSTVQGWKNNYKPARRNVSAAQPSTTTTPVTGAQ